MIDQREPSPSVIRNGHTLRMLIAMSVLVAFSGARNAYQHLPSLLDVLTAVMVNVCLGGWSIHDSRLRQKPLPTSTHMWFFFFAIILVPCYVVWTRGWRGLGWLLLCGLLVGLIFRLSENATGILLYGEAWFL